jgi:hypothetical protein
LIDLGKDFVFTGSSQVLFNAGHFLVKNSEFGRRMIDNWLSLEGIIFPKLNTTHQNLDGSLMDNPGGNLVLTGGFNFDRNQAVRIFNYSNGWLRNQDRFHKNFHRKYAPITKRNLENARSLIHEEIRSRVGVVIKNRLNAFPFNEPGSRAGWKKSPIVHFCGGYAKTLLPEYCVNQKII